MTAEEKARAYDEAMDRCKEWVSGTWEHSVDDTPKDIAEFIFPQLAESEDERIRQAIIHYILYETKGAISEATEHTWVKWLEKQKEPENVSASTIIPSCWEIKQKDQKPAWSEGFEQNIRNLLHDKLTWHSDDWSMSSAVFIDDKTIKDIVTGIWFYVGKEMMKNPNMELPKPEWGEEDEDMLWNIISIVGESKSIQADEMLDWLKSLSPSWKPNVDDADEQPEADLEKEIQKYLEKLGGGHGGYVDDLTDDDLMGFARHFYELGQCNARKEEQK